jgi:hypothetical protein
MSVRGDIRRVVIITLCSRVTGLAEGMRRDLRHMKPEDLPAIVVFDAQDNTYHDLGDLARDRLLGLRVMTLEVLETPEMEGRRYLFAQ